MRGGVNILVTESTTSEEVRDALFLVEDLGAEVVVYNFQWCLDGEDAELRSCELTPRESLVVEACELARAMGLETRLRPLVSERAVGWRGALQAHPAWMESYRDLVLDLSLFAQLHEIDTVYVISELHRAMRETPGFFAELIWAARELYDGEIAVTEFIWSSHGIPGDWFFSETHPGRVGVDIVGSSYYPELQYPEDELSPQMDDFLNRVSFRTDDFLDQIDEVSEFGVVPSPQGRTATWTIEGQLDEEYQARYYAAILESMRGIGVDTSVLWGLEPGHPDFDYGPFAPLQMGQEVLKGEWSRLRAGD